VPVTPTYPGVYVEEIPSGVHTITGVATSVAAFVDFFGRGEMNKAVQVFNMGDFERELGGLNAQSEASYAIQQFFLNGGSEAWIVRVASGNFSKAAVTVQVSGANTPALTITTISEGAWGNKLRARVDSLRSDGTRFNLVITEYQTIGGVDRPARSETYLDLAMSPVDLRFVEKVVNGPSKLVTVKSEQNNPAPAQTGTVSDVFTGADPTVTFAGTDPLQLSVTIGSGGVQRATLPPKPAQPVKLAEAAAMLESAIRAAKPDDPQFAGATIQVAPGNRLRVLAGPGGDPTALITFGSAGTTDTTTVDELKLVTNAVANVQEYTLGNANAIANTAQAAGVVGSDGAVPDAGAIIGNLANKTGLFALEDVDIFNILCLPGTQAPAVLSAAEAYCDQRRAFLIVDAPPGVTTPAAIRTWLQTNAAVKDRNAAVYYPRVTIPDPLNEFRPKTVGPSGTIAGLYARTDGARGVWKAPAGTEGSLRNVSELEYKLTDQENGALNPLGINALRNFPVYGNVCWGARTLNGSDEEASEWKYVPVRRLALYLEESLYRGTKWAVFEPNDEPLWAQIRLNVGAFMHNLFRQGAFQGNTARKAYFVKCDSETTTQNDIDLGIVNIVVGFAPLKPAEFVIIRIQQIAGQIET
jgi:Bacteriophage tail sheath protein